MALGIPFVASAEFRTSLGIRNAGNGPSHGSHEPNQQLVVQVMELVELIPLRNALVGLPGVSGLSVEQRKRLTIAVELVANPSAVFMDEPTSGEPLLGSCSRWQRLGNHPVMWAAVSTHQVQGKRLQASPWQSAQKVQSRHHSQMTVYGQSLLPNADWSQSFGHSKAKNLGCFMPG